MDKYISSIDVIVWNNSTPGLLDEYFTLNVTVSYIISVLEALTLFS